MKKGRLLRLSTLALCLTLLMFGVYAVSKNATLNVSGTVGLIAHDAELSVWGSYGNVVTYADDMSGNTYDVTFFSEENPYNFKDEGSFVLNETTLRDENDSPVSAVYFSDAKEEVPSITFTLNIKNESIFKLFPTIEVLTAGENILVETTQAVSTIYPEEVQTLILTMSIEDIDETVNTASNFNLKINFDKSFKLRAPQNIVIDEETNEISFDEVPEAKDYTVAFMKDGEIVTIQDLTTNNGILNSFPGQEGDYEIYVKANADVDNELANDSDYAYADTISTDGITLYVENGKLYTNIGVWDKRPIRWFAYAKEDENGNYVSFTQQGDVVEAGNYKFISEYALTHRGMERHPYWVTDTGPNFTEWRSYINGSFANLYAFKNDALYTATEGTRIKSDFYVPTYDECFNIMAKEDLTAKFIETNEYVSWWTSTVSSGDYMYGIDGNGEAFTLLCIYGIYIRPITTIEIV